MSVVNCFLAIQKYMEILFSIPFWSILVSFLFSTITAWASFHVFIISDPVYEKLKSCKQKYEKLSQEGEKFKYEKVSYSFKANYCFLTGVLSTCISSLQFNNNPNLITSILYSLVGPFVIRDKMISSLAVDVKDVVSGISREKNDDISEIEKSVIEDIEKKIEGDKKESSCNKN